MYQLFPIIFKGKVSFIATLLAMIISFNSFGQNQLSSLTYPSPYVASAEVSKVFLSPNISGNVSVYTISPSLPAGLSFNANTGIISGIPTAASPSTNYTITAKNNTTGSTATFVLNLIITNNFYNNNNQALSFAGPIINGATGATISGNTSDNMIGRSAGQSVVYKKVTTIDGTEIDCIVTTESLTNFSSWTAYDQHQPSSSNFSNNSPDFFSPQIVFNSNADGNIVFKFQFILGNSYNHITGTGLNVTLKNVRLNTYDLDGNGQANSNQFTEFGGFQSSELTNGTGAAVTKIQTPVYNTVTGLTKFRSNTSNNVVDVLDPTTRVRVNFDYLSEIRVSTGGRGTAYFFLDFSAGGLFNTNITTAPSIDLDPSIPGVNYYSNGCLQAMPFTTSGTNIQTSASDANNITQLSVSYLTSHIRDGANEIISIDGTTTKIALNSSSVPTFSIGGISYNANTIATASGVTTITFKRSSGNITITQAEALLDALRYENIAAAPTTGTRNFIVNIFTSQFKSPDAVFTTNVSCVSISGFIYHDSNGFTDSLINASNSTQFAANTMYAVLVNPADNKVITSAPISAGGAYTLGRAEQGKYIIMMSTSAPAVGSTFTESILPSGFVPIGENLGNGKGHDITTDGKLYITLGSEPITGANFGIERSPITTNNTISNIKNPGGNNFYSIPNGSFITSDADGTVDRITINSFPTGANYLKVGNIYYTNGAPCPPQATCVTWPGTLNVPFASGNPTSTISVDPASDGNTSVSINFTAWDNAQISGNSSTLTMNFEDVTPNTISGKVWHDINGNGAIETGENGIAPANSGEKLYAVLVQMNNTYSGVPTIYNAVVVDENGNYSFENVPSGSNYEVKIYSQSTAPVKGAAASTLTNKLKDNWTGVSTNDGTPHGGQNTNNLVIAINNLSGNKSQMNFGIEQKPDSDPKTVNVRKIEAGTVITLDGTGLYPSLTGSDPEDGILGGGNSVQIVTLPEDAVLSYNGIPVTAGQIINNYDPTKLNITINHSLNKFVEFQYAFIDEAGVVDPTPATYTITAFFVLPVQITSFTAKGENGNAILNWSTSSEMNSKGFAVQHSINGTDWKQVGFVNSKVANSSVAQQYQFTHTLSSNGTHYYRLQQVDLDGNYAYSDIRKVEFTSTKNAVNVYPNPVREVVNVEGLNGNETIRIFDTNGRMVIAVKAKNVKETISTESLANGIYIMEIADTNGNKETKRILKGK